MIFQPSHLLSVHFSESNFLREWLYSLSVSGLKTSPVINQSSYSENLSRFSSIEVAGNFAKLQYAIIELSLCRSQLCELCIFFLSLVRVFISGNHSFKMFLSSQQVLKEGPSRVCMLCKSFRFEKVGLEKTKKDINIFRSLKAFLERYKQTTPETNGGHYEEHVSIEYSQQSYPTVKPAALFDLLDPLLQVLG